MKERDELVNQSINNRRERGRTSLFHDPRTFHFSSAPQGLGFFLLRRRQPQFKNELFHLYFTKNKPFAFHFSNGADKNLRVWIPAIFKGGGGANKKLERLPGNVNFCTKGHIETGLQKHKTSWFWNRMKLHIGIHSCCQLHRVVILASCTATGGQTCRWSVILAFNSKVIRYGTYQAKLNTFIC